MPATEFKQGERVWESAALQQQFWKQTFRELLAHQAATHEITIVGEPINVDGKWKATVWCLHALVEAAANTNPGSFLIQGNALQGGSAEWTTLVQFTATTATPATEVMTATEPVTEKVLAVAATAGFAASNGIYVANTTLVNSEWHTVQEIVTNTSIDILDGLANEQASQTIWGSAEVFVATLSVVGMKRLRVVFLHEGAAAANAHVKAYCLTHDAILQ